MSDELVESDPLTYMETHGGTLRQGVLPLAEGNICSYSWVYVAAGKRGKGPTIASAVQSHRNPPNPPSVSG